MKYLYKLDQSNYILNSGEIIVSDEEETALKEAFPLHVISEISLQGKPIKDADGFFCYKGDKAKSIKSNITLVNPAKEDLKARKILVLKKRFIGELKAQEKVNGVNEEKAKTLMISWLESGQQGTAPIEWTDWKTLRDGLYDGDYTKKKTWTNSGARTLKELQGLDQWEDFPTS